MGLAARLRRRSSYGTQPPELGVADEIERLARPRHHRQWREGGLAGRRDALDPALEVDVSRSDRFETSAWIARAIASELGTEFFLGRSLWRTATARRALAAAP